MAVELFELYEDAGQSNIDVVWFPLRADQSMAIQTEDGLCAIAIDPWKMDTIAKETTCLAHEMGHCKTGSFYNPYAPLDKKKKHENRADKWAIRRLIPAAKFHQAIAEGHTELWDLAEYFGV